MDKSGTSQTISANEAVADQPSRHQQSIEPGRATEPSRDPRDDPDLARYLLPRAPSALVDEPPGSQELSALLLHTPLDVTTTRGASSPVAPRPIADRLAVYAAVLAEMREAT